jgi:hypothetical protein
MEIQITIKHNELEDTRRYQQEESDDLYNDLYNRDWNERVQSLIEDFTDFLKDQENV